MAEDVGIVIPALDPEPERIAAYIDALDRELSPARIHVELDRPTRAVLEALAETPATVETSDKRRGKGASVAAGFDRLDTGVLAFVDADGSTPPVSFQDIIEPVLDGQAQLSVGSRRHPDADIREHQKAIRRYLGDVLVTVAQHTLPIALFDYQCGAKAIARDCWDQVRDDIVATGFAWDIELIAVVAAHGFAIEEVPIEWHDRPGSTVPLRGTVSDFGIGLLRARHRAKCIQGDPFHRSIDRWSAIARQEIRAGWIGK